MDTIYIERGVRDHPRALAVLERYARATVIEVERYGEVFNRRAQNFRIQKERPSLILAAKQGGLVLPTPPGYTIGSPHNYYFSHMLNCLYDCRYCFLQGMYQSAHYVFFVNFEAFESALDEVIARHPGEEVSFFSGYDCDSLAMEQLTGFAEHFLPWFAQREHAQLELRTKSLNTRCLQAMPPSERILPAFTLTPSAIGRAVEHGAPPVERRLDRVEALVQQGWQVGLRLDPLIPWPNFEALYEELIVDIFTRVPALAVHSVTVGPMRFPKAMHEKIVKLYPDEPLYARHEMTAREGQVGFLPEQEEAMLASVTQTLARYIPPDRVFAQI